MRKLTGKATILAAAIAASAAVTSAHASDVSYTTGDTSLANGKVTFAYDESSKITELRIDPARDETITLTGDAFTFAANAHIMTGSNGVSRICNAMTASGYVLIGAGPQMTWGSTSNGTALTTNSKGVKLFSNVNINDVSPVRAYNKINGVFYLYPYWIERSGDTMTVEFEAIDDRHVKGIRVKLWQSGTDIYGQKLDSKYYNGHADWLGFRMWDTPASTVSSITYNVYELIIGPRCDTWDYRGNLISNTFDTVVATNVNVADLEILHGASGHESRHDLSANIVRAQMLPHHQAYDEASGILSAQLVNTNTAGTVKCVKVELRQSGRDVVARVAYAKYADGNDADTDFDSTGTEVTIATEANYADAANETMYGVDMLAMRRHPERWTHKARLVLPISGTVSLPVAFRGYGAEVTFAAESATATVNVSGDNSMMSQSAFVIQGDDEHRMVFNVNHINALPGGTTDCYGDAELHLTKAPSSFKSGTSAGKSLIKMHPGSRLYQSNDFVFHSTAQKVILDGASLYAQYGIAETKQSYLNHLVLTNGAAVLAETAAKCFRVGYWDGATWQVSGVGVSSADSKFLIYGYGADRREVTFDIADTVLGADADFVVNGIIEPNSSHPQGAVKKTGVGTMQINGTFAMTNQATHVVAGTFLLGRSGVTPDEDGHASFSLDGGTLAFAAGTTNTTGAIAVTTASTLFAGEGAAAVLDNITVSDGAMLEVMQVNAMSVKVNAALGGVTLAKIRLNGKRTRQSRDGHLCSAGLMIIVK